MVGGKFCPEVGGGSPIGPEVERSDCTPPEEGGNEGGVCLEVDGGSSCPVDGVGNSCPADGMGSEVRGGNRPVVIVIINN